MGKTKDFEKQPAFYSTRYRNSFLNHPFECNFKVKTGTKSIQVVLNLLYLMTQIIMALGKSVL